MKSILPTQSSTVSQPNSDLFSLIRMAVSEGLEQVLDAHPSLKGTTNTQASEWLSIDEAAAYLNLAKATVYGLVSQRRIPFFKRGKRLYFKQSDLAAWLSDTRKDTIEEIEQRIRTTGRIDSTSTPIKGNVH